MNDDTQAIRGIDWKATFPFTRIFRSFRIAVHPSKIVLALAALILIYVGGWVLDGIWPSSYRAVPGELYLYSTLDSRGEANRFRDAVRDTRAQMNSQIAAETTRVDSIRKTTGSKLKDVIYYYRVTARDEQVAIVKSAYDAAKKRYDDADKTTPERKKLAETSRANAEAARNLEMERIDAESTARVQETAALRGEGLFATFYGSQIGLMNQTAKAVRNGDILGTRGIIASLIDFFTAAPAWGMRHHTVFFTLYFAWFLAVWAVFGGAVARIAAVHVARDEKISIRQALRFSTAKFLSFFSAPLIPLLVVLIIGLAIAVGGLLTNVPYIGPVVVGAFFVLALGAGFVITLVLLGSLGGSSMMYPTIAVEGSDSFDAISRSFSYLYARPWRLAMYTAVAVVYASLTYLFVRLFIGLLLTVTNTFAGLFVFTRSRDPNVYAWPKIWPNLADVGRLSYSIEYWTLDAGQKLGAFFISAWVYLLIGLLGAFVISMYFTTSTIIYFLMRADVDATELDDVYLEQSDEEFVESQPAGVVTTETVAVVDVQPGDPPPNTGV